MRDLILVGVDLDLDLAAELAEKLAPQSVLTLPGESAVRICGVADSSDRSVLKPLLDGHHVDLFDVPDGFSAKRFKILATDLDNTLIENECIDDMAFAAHRTREMHAALELARAEKCDASETLRRRVAVLEGANVSSLEYAVQAERFSDGAEKLVKFAKRLGMPCYVISCGFVQIAAAAVKKLGLSGAVTNELVIKDGVVTGEVRGPAGGRLMDSDGKRRTLEILAQLNGCELDEAIALGDGGNDAGMVAAAGCGVAYRPKPALCAANPAVVIRHSGLGAVMLLFVEAWTDAFVRSSKAKK